MPISKLEAAAYYAYINGKAPWPPGYLVLALDSCCAAYCICSPGGTVQTAASTSVPGGHDIWQDCLGQVKQAMGDAAAEAMEGQFLFISHQMDTYLLSDRILDGTVLEAAGRTVSCSQLEAWLAPVKQTLLTLLNQASRLVPKDAEDQMAIVLTGRAAVFSWIQYQIRSFFSADAFLPDARFVNDGCAHGPEEIAEAGMTYFRRQTMAGHSISLLMAGEQAVRLVSEEQQKAELSQPSYFGPVFIAGQEPLHIQADGKPMEIPLPASASPENGGLIDIAAGLNKEGFCLLIRDSRQPERVYRTDIIVTVQPSTELLQNPAQ